MIDPLTDLLALDGFRTGALFGFAASLGVALVVVVGRRERPWAGLAFAAAAVLALADEFTVEADVVIGLGLLAAGGYLTARRGPVVQLVAAVPGAVVFARAADLDTPGWASPTIVGVTLVGGVLVAAFDRSFGAQGLPPVLLAVTTLGIYLTTPDTEHSAILLGAALPVALLGWPRPLASLGAGGASAAVALVAWTVVLDGAGRDGAVVGGVACLGMLVVEPVVRWASRRPATAGSTRPMRHALVVAPLHVALVAACSRVAGLRSSAAEALVICALAYLVAAGVLVWATQRLDADA
jgi:hypothetical protein